MPSRFGMTRSIRTTSGARLGGGQRLAAVGRLADDLDVVLEVEEGAQALAYDGVVVGDQDADHPRHLEPHRGPLAGRGLDRRACRPARPRAPPSRSARAVARAGRRPAGSNPRPSSATVRISRPSPSPPDAPRSARASACRSAFCSASWAMRNTSPLGLRAAAAPRRRARSPAGTRAAAPSTCLRSVGRQALASSEAGRSSKRQRAQLLHRASARARSTRSTCSAAAAGRGRAASRPTPRRARRRTAAA